MINKYHQANDSGRLVAPMAILQAVANTRIHKNVIAGVDLDSSDDTDANMSVSKKQKVLPNSNDNSTVNEATTLLSGSGPVINFNFNFR
jgi:hypothetical protein